MHTRTRARTYTRHTHTHTPHIFRTHTQTCMRTQTCSYTSTRMHTYMRAHAVSNARAAAGTLNCRLSIAARSQTLSCYLLLALMRTVAWSRCESGLKMESRVSRRGITGGDPRVPSACVPLASISSPYKVQTKGDRLAAHCCRVCSAFGDLIARLRSMWVGLRRAVSICDAHATCNRQQTTE